MFSFLSANMQPNYKRAKKTLAVLSCQQQAIAKLLIPSVPLQKNDKALNGGARGLRIYLRGFLKGIHFHNITMLSNFLSQHLRAPILILYDDSFDADNKEIYYFQHHNLCQRSCFQNCLPFLLVEALNSNHFCCLRNLVPINC